MHGDLEPEENVWRKEPVSDLYQDMERLNALYDELKSLKPYLPFQQIKRVLAELKWVKSMREDGVYNDPDPIEETS